MASEDDTRGSETLVMGNTMETTEGEHIVQGNAMETIEGDQLAQGDNAIGDNGDPQMQQEHDMPEADEEDTEFVLMVETLEKLRFPSKKMIFLENGSLNRADVSEGEWSTINTQLLQETDHVDIYRFATTLLRLGVFPEWDENLLLSILCSGSAELSTIETMIKRKRIQMHLSEVTVAHRKSNGSKNTARGMKQARSEMIEFSLFNLASSSMFGLSAKVILGRFYVCSFKHFVLILCS